MRAAVSGVKVLCNFALRESAPGVTQLQELDADLGVVTICVRDQQMHASMKEVARELVQSLL